MSKIIKPNPGGIVIPKHIIKERIDEHHRRDWADPERYLREKQRALQYIPVRAPDLPDTDRLLGEVSRVFHDDLQSDPEVREAVQLAVWTAQRAAREAERDGLPTKVTQLEPGERPIKAGQKAPREKARGLDNPTDEQLRDLEAQRYEEDHEP